MRLTRSKTSHSNTIIKLKQLSRLKHLAAEDVLGYEWSQRNHGYNEPISGPTRPQQLQLQQFQLQQQQQLVPTSYESFYNNFIANNNNHQQHHHLHHQQPNYISGNITQTRYLYHPQQQQQQDTTTPPTYYNYNYNYYQQQQQQQQLQHQQQLQQQHQLQQQLYNPFYSQQHLQSAGAPYYSTKSTPPPLLFGSGSLTPSSYLGGSSGFGLGLTGLGLGGLGASLGGGGSGYTPLGRSYRYYKHHTSTGLGNTSYNGYYSLSFGESYYPFQSTGGGGGAGGGVVGENGGGSGVGALTGVQGGGGDYFGRISPAAAHTGPLLATSVSEPRNSLLKLPPPPPPPLLPPLDDDLQVNTEPYLSTYSSRPIDYIPSPPASLRSDTYAYRPRRPRDTGGRYSATGYYSRQRSRGFSPIIDCDRFRDREFSVPSRLRTNSLQSNCSLGRSSFTAFDRLSPIRVGTSPRTLRREKYLSPCGSPKYSSKTSSTLQQQTAHDSQYHSQAYDSTTQKSSGTPAKVAAAIAPLQQQALIPPPSQQQQSQSTHYHHSPSSHQHSHHHHSHHSSAPPPPAIPPKLEQPQPYQPYQTQPHQQQQQLSSSDTTYHTHKRTHHHSKTSDQRDYHSEQLPPPLLPHAYQQQPLQPAINTTTSNIYSTQPQQYQQQQQQQQHQQHYPQHDDSCEDFHHLASSLNCFRRHRMMVSKLWKGCFPDVTPEHVHRHNFYLCQWQRNTQVRIIYLFYRWITAIICLAALVCSLLDVGRSDEHFENHYAKWWIYLTHWGLLFCTVQAWLAAMIVTQGMMVEREDFELMRQAKKSKLHLLYWVLYTLATVYAFIITMCYWLLVHDPEIHKIDTLNIMVHVLNSIIMLIDLAIVGHPIKLSFAYFTTGVGLAYAIFTGIYFLAGGTDRKLQVAIYPMLDWTKPGKAIIVTVCAIIFVFIVHFCCFLMYRARVWLFTKLCIRGSHHRDREFCEGLNEDSCTRLGPGGSSAEYSHQQQFPATVHSEQPHRTQFTVATSAAATQQLSTEHVYANAPSHHHQSAQPHQQQQQLLQPQQQQQSSHQHQHHQPHPPPHQYPPQYSGYQQQPVVAGVNVGVISSADIYQHHQHDNNNKHHQHSQQQQQQSQKTPALVCGSANTIAGGGGGGGGASVGAGNTTAVSASPSSSALSRTVAHLDAAQREQFLNPNQIVEYKM